MFEYHSNEFLVLIEKIPAINALYSRNDVVTFSNKFKWHTEFIKCHDVKFDEFEF